jgi:hypothetical protein
VAGTPSSSHLLNPLVRKSVFLDPLNFRILDYVQCRSSIHARFVGFHPAKQRVEMVFSKRDADLGPSELEP